MKLHHILTETSQPDITFDKQYGTFYANDHNTYDGAPDSDMRHQGEGKSKKAAMLDLLDQLEQDGVYPADVLKNARQQAMSYDRPTHKL